MSSFLINRQKLIKSNKEIDFRHQHTYSPEEASDFAKFISLKNLRRLLCSYRVDSTGSKIILEKKLAKLAEQGKLTQGCFDGAYL